MVTLTYPAIYQNHSCSILATVYLDSQFIWIKLIKKQSVLPLLFIGIGTVLFLSAIYISTNLRTESQTSQLLTSEEETFSEIPRVTIKDAFTAFQDGSAVFIDVRDAESYASSHIPGAKSFPLAQLDVQLKKLNTETWIITYCTWPSEESSARAARLLLDNGFKKVTPILGGYRAWEQAGYPVESSP